MPQPEQTTLVENQLLPAQTIKFFLMAIAGFSYMAIVLLLFPASNTSVYGFPTQLSFIQALEGTIQIGPLIIALCSLLLAPMRANYVSKQLAKSTQTSNLLRFGLRHSYVVVKLHLYLAIVFSLLTLVPVFLNTTLPPMMNHNLIAYLLVTLLFDLTIIGIFTHFIFRLYQHWLLAVGIFIGYILLVIFVGSATGLIKLIGFASSSSIIVTHFNDLPLLYEQANAFRLYWFTVSVLLLFIMALAPSTTTGLITQLSTLLNQLRASKPAMISALVLIGSIILQFSHLNSTTEQQNTSGITSENDALLDKHLSKQRATLTTVDLKFDHQISEQSLYLDASLQFFIQPTAQDIQTVSLQKPALLIIDELNIAAPFAYKTIETRDYYHLIFDSPLAEDQQFTVSYKGAINNDKQNPNAIKILDEGVFLTSSDFLLQSRASYCVAHPAKANEFDDCSENENYLMTDKITGNISVFTAEQREVISYDRHFIQYRYPNSGRLWHKFKIAQQESAVFSLSINKLRERSIRTEISTIMAFLSDYIPDPIASDIVVSAREMLDYYQQAIPLDRPVYITLIEQPSHLGEAVNLNDVIGMSEQLLHSRGVGKNVNEMSLLTEFVLAHEIAHHWFGYNIVPAPQSGRDFILESFAQFMAYSYMQHADKQGLSVSMQREMKRYCHAVNTLKLEDSALSQLTNQQHLAYHKGAYVLLKLNELTDNQLMAYISMAMQQLSSKQLKNNQLFIDTLIEQLPVTIQKEAKSLFYAQKADALCKVD